MANLQADPRLIVHALGQDHPATTDRPATTQPVTDRDVRRRFFAQPNAEIAWYRSQTDLNDLIDNAPMIEVHLQP